MIMIIANNGWNTWKECPDPYVHALLKDTS